MTAKIGTYNHGQLNVANITAETKGSIVNDDAVFIRDSQDDDKLKEVAYSLISGGGGGSANTTQTLTDGETISWDIDNGNFATVTLAGNRTLAAATNQNDTLFNYLIVKQDATGSRTLTWNSNYLFPGGTDPVLTTDANAVDIFIFITDGTNMYCIANYNFK